MEQKKILYMGIDLTDEQAMVSLFGRGMEEPETIMTGASKERYGIPVAMYLADSGHIFYGEEALRRKENPQGDFFDHLYQRALDETESESKFYQGLLRQFVQRLIQLKDRYRFDAQELCVSITVPEITKQVVTVFQWMRKELGLFGAICVILMYILLLWRLLLIATNAKDMFGSYLVIGIMVHIALQVILNIAVVTNTIPNTGITLPFISYGGTSIVFLEAEMGMVLSVSNQIKLEK